MKNSCLISCFVPITVASLLLLSSCEGWVEMIMIDYVESIDALLPDYTLFPDPRTDKEGFRCVIDDFEVYSYVNFINYSPNYVRYKNNKIYLDHEVKLYDSYGRISSTLDEPGGPRYDFNICLLSEDGFQEGVKYYITEEKNSSDHFVTLRVYDEDTSVRLFAVNGTGWVIIERLDSLVLKMSMEFDFPVSSTGETIHLCDGLLYLYISQ